MTAITTNSFAYQAEALVKLAARGTTYNLQAVLRVYPGARQGTLVGPQPQESDCGVENDLHLLAVVSGGSVAGSEITRSVLFLPDVAAGHSLEFLLVQLDVTTLTGFGQIVSRAGRPQITAPLCSIQRGDGCPVPPGF